MFDRVLALKPNNWSAMWVVGKVQQRLGDEAAALNWFEKSWQAHPSHPDVAREASLSAMHLGRSNLAIVYAHHAAQLDPQSAGLQANLALAYLLAGQLQQAQTNIDLSLKADPADPISKSVQAIIKHFASTRQPPPKTLQDLQVYWSKHTSK